MAILDLDVVVLHWVNLYTDLYINRSCDVETGVA